MRLKLPERRRFIRIEVPMRIKIEGDGWLEEATTRNISPIGMRFETAREFKKSEILNLVMYLPSSGDNSIRVKGKIVWQRKTSLEDNAPYDVGLEITHIEDEGKNVLLKYLCDLLYDSSYHSD
ncbi:MAG: PilZ domain-containing protein [Candidatus Omnitrophica bacterium]|nr:PilZ domain-containing protein [Candidatus Omnitrophota bacterium]MBU1128741.1 PilZ domain-containing protein [Candidatus Omnitrophota bacterium]MBU1784003.1 PilZ domain-containing protein [Candidatus Omnitrophota bacterium]MBU1851780.1 PilZ domain-containing protein [Candidatus Omnitrophota bacterium]